MSDWFFMLGEPLAPVERLQVRDYLRGLAILEELPVESVIDWNSAGRAISTPDWDRRWWDAEQRESKRLYTKASAIHGESEVQQCLSRTLEEWTERAHGAAAVEAARGGCTDPALIRAAAGAVSQVIHLAELAELARENEEHPFLLKQALFAGGHWPLGIVGGRYYIF